MKLLSELVKLPLRFDSRRLVEEISQFSPSDWTTNPSGLVGNSALILVSVKGEINDEFAISGQMQPTNFLLRSPYLQQVLKAIAAPISRTRLMRIAPGAKVTAVDTSTGKITLDKPNTCPVDPTKPAGS